MERNDFKTGSPLCTAAELDFWRIGKGTPTWELEPAGARTKVNWGFQTPVEGIDFETGRSALVRSIRKPRKANAIVSSGFRRLKKQNGAKEVAAMPSVAAM